MSWVWLPGRKCLFAQVEGLYPPAGKLATHR